MAVAFGGGFTSTSSSVGSFDTLLCDAYFASDKEKIQQLQHQLESTSSKIREELRQEFFSLIKQHNQAPPLNAAPTTTAPQPAENMVSGNEGADLAQAGTESALPTHNEPAVVPTPIQGSEHVQQTVPDSVLLSKQKSIQPSHLTRSANRSLFPNDKDSNETVTFITSQTLRNTAANKKLQCRKKGGKKINLEGVLAS
ncbi:uncharacterized protein [Miscanthus floridulus]|uniref:uncharacterized protein isoform X4 n=1 Tax=Miscanthus floridulus TaxID=154761 RepID=UPI00345A89D3